MDIFEHVNETDLIHQPFYHLQSMEFIAAGIAWGLNKVPPPQKVLTRLGLASLLAPSPVIWSELSSKLSPQASIVLPGESSFNSHIIRWREWHSPDVGVVVNVFTEGDVQETV